MNIQLRRPGRILALALFAILMGTLPCDADTHIFAGAQSTNQGAKLFFSNGFVFDANLTNTYLPQILRTNGLNEGHYRGDSLTFAGLSATISNGGEIPGHAALGTRLAIQVVSVVGPAGGRFEFWEGDGESDLGVITLSVPAGTTNGANAFVISENQGEAGADPYGHIHGREFTTSAPGTYIVGFRVIDISTNGPGGGPLQVPSDVLPVKFQAGLHVDATQIFTNRVSVMFRSPTAISNLLEAANSPDSTSWVAVAGPLRGNNVVQTLTETNTPSGNRFYRLRVLNNFP